MRYGPLVGPGKESVDVTVDLPSGSRHRRNQRWPNPCLHMIRYPGLSVFTILGPVVILLLFVFVFGGTLGAGLPGVDPAAGRDAYLAYVIPGILLITIAGTADGTSTTVSMDMTEGITARFRTMAISRAAVPTGHVLGNTLQGIICPSSATPGRLCSTTGSRCAYTSDSDLRRCRS